MQSLRGNAVLPHANEGHSICLEQSRRFYSVRETLSFLNTIWSEVLGSKDQIEQQEPC